MRKSWRSDVIKFFIVPISTAFFLAACGGVAPSDPVETEPVETLQDSLAGVTTAGVQSLDSVKGNTPAEKLIYLLDTPAGAKAGILINLDSQIEGLKAVGQTETAQVLSESKPLFMQAVDENMDEFLSIASKVYESRFTDEELTRLAELNADPVMQKHISQQVDIMSDMTVAIEAWAEVIGARYAELLEENQSE